VGSCTDHWAPTLAAVGCWVRGDRVTTMRDRERTCQCASGKIRPRPYVLSPRSAVFCCLLAVMVLSGLPPIPRSQGDSAMSSDYALGPQDKVRVRAFEWRASLDQVFEWSALNSEYVVGAGGKVSLPLVGEIPATGKTTGELAVAIGGALKARIGLAEGPDVSVEVVQFRPLYVVGDVERPGEYAYRPGLTVLQAISIAGGMARVRDAGLLRLGRELIATKGDLGLLESELVSTLARKARLESELAGLDEIALPGELNLRALDGTLIALLHQEGLLFQSRKAAVDTQAKALEQLKASLEMEAASLAKQIAAHDSQIRLMDEELAKVSQLYSKGLSTAARKLGLERNAAQLLGERLRLEAGLARVNQEARKTDISILELRNRRLNDVTTELRQTEVKLGEITQRKETAERLLSESRASSSQLVAARTTNAQQGILPRYTIVRPRRGGSVELEATEATLVEPGDTIKVESAAAREARLEVAKKQDRRSAPASPQPEDEKGEDATRIGYRRTGGFAPVTHGDAVYSTPGSEN
jgi:protein involved in polysaccharide export with SLBB domain